MAKNKLLEAIEDEQNFTETENGAGAYKSTLSACLDAFGALGAARRWGEEDIAEMYSKAFSEDPVLAIRMAFYFRDVREGQGERRVFHIILRWLAEHAPEYVENNLANILHYGYGKDYLCLFDTSLEKQAIDYIDRQLSADWLAHMAGKPISLLAKWLPSENSHSKQTRYYARKICAQINMRPSRYRKVLAALRNYIGVIETKMSARDWDQIDYERVPSKAGLLYGDAFFRHDEDRYVKYLTDAALGKVKMNAGALFPVDIVGGVIKKFNNHNRKDVFLYDTMWKNLKNYFEGREETGICVVDTSGSMAGEPMNVAISLGMYCADKCRGPFQGNFITFSSNPEMQKITGVDIFEKVRNISRSNWQMNTDLEAVFDLILNTAKNAGCKQEDMPSKLYIISDMQFDEARGDGDYSEFNFFAGHYERKTRTKKTFMQSMKAKYENAGYTMPAIVYWNVRASECGMFQETFEGENCCMVSGYSPSLFEAVMNGTVYVEEEVVKEDGTVEKRETAYIDPMTMMIKTLTSPRYDLLWDGALKK